MTKKKHASLFFSHVVFVSWYWSCKGNQKTSDSNRNHVSLRLNWQQCTPSYECGYQITIVMMLIKKTLENVSNLVKLSLLFYRAYKYELIFLNKKIHFSTFHSVCYSQFNNLNSKLKFNKPSNQSKTIPESSVPWIIEMTLKCLCHSCVVNCCSLCLYCQCVLMP